MKIIFSIIVALAIILPCLADSFAHTHWGHNLENTNHYTEKNNIKPCNVDKLTIFCNMTLDGTWVTGPPAVKDNVAYFGDFKGNLYAFNVNTCVRKWKVYLPDITGKNGTFGETFGGTMSLTRHTPALSGNKLVVSDFNSGRVFCFNANNGNLIWMNNVETHPFARMAQSAIIRRGVVYVGTTSTEEAAVFSQPPGYVYSFRGSFLALDLADGTIIWRQYMTPLNYSGNAIWSSAPSIDESRNAIYIATGNNYDFPLSVKACINATNSINCTAQDNYSDSIVALDLTTGGVLGFASFAGKYGIDAFNLACTAGLPSCPTIPGEPEPDSDLAQGVMLLSTQRAGLRRDMACVGSKNGKLYCIDRDLFDILWLVRLGPASDAGGIMFGQAYDGERLFISQSNGEHIAFVDAFGRNMTGGSWNAIDPHTGVVLWSTPEPTGERVYGPLSISNGVLYGGSLSTTGDSHFALSALTGEILWSMKTMGTFAAPTIYKGKLIWGEGYGLGASAGNFATKVYVLGVPHEFEYCENEVSYSTYYEDD